MGFSFDCLVMYNVEYTQSLPQSTGNFLEDQRYNKLHVRDTMYNIFRSIFIHPKCIWSMNHKKHGKYKNSRTLTLNLAYNRSSLEDPENSGRSLEPPLQSKALSLWRTLLWVAMAFFNFWICICFFAAVFPLACLYRVSEKLKMQVE